MFLAKSWLDLLGMSVESFVWPVDARAARHRKGPLINNSIVVYIFHILPVHHLPSSIFFTGRLPLLQVYIVCSSNHVSFSF